MYELSSYRIVKKISENDLVTTYRGNSQKYKTNLLLRIIKVANYNTTESLQLKSIYQKLQNINSRHIVHVYAIENCEAGILMVFEEFPGVSLRDFDNSNMNLAAFLKIAIQLASALEAIHAHDIIHYRVNPSNIFINIAENLVKLDNFGTVDLIKKNCFLEDLAYFSPEQTERMNHIVDYRTDLYSLGVVFYEMLTQKRPFHAENAMAIIYGHLARTP